MLQNTSGGCFCISCRTASVCCRRKVAAVKIEKLKAFIIRYCDISKTYSIQFHLSCSVNLSYFYFFIHGFQNSRTIAPEENWPPPKPKTNPKLNANPNRGTIFFGGNCLVAPNPKTNPDFGPNPNPNPGGFSLEGNCPDTDFQSSILHKLKSTLNCRFK